MADDDDVSRTKRTARITNLFLMAHLPEKKILYLYILYAYYD